MAGQASVRDYEGAGGAGGYGAPKGGWVWSSSRCCATQQVAAAVMASLELLGAREGGACLA